MVRAMIMWGEVSMCDTPPTLMILHVDLVQHFIRATRITTDSWSLVMYTTDIVKFKLIYDRQSASLSWCREPIWDP
jgi:hypothetical protein